VIDVSSEYKAALRDTHRVHLAAHVYDNEGRLINDLSGGLTGGSVVIDASAAFMRRCTLVVDRSVVPSAGGGGSYGPARNRFGDFRNAYGTGGARTYGELAQAPSELSPMAGHELRVWRGVNLGGVVEWASLGVYSISSVRASAAPGSASVEITGYDRARHVSLAKWLKPFQIDGTKDAHVVVRDIVEDRAPALKFSTRGVTSSKKSAPAVLGTSTANDPWQDVQDIAAAADLEVFFDEEGNLVVRNEPLSTGSTVWTFNAGEGGVLIDREYEESDDGVFNAVIVTADAGAAGFSLRAQAYDSDPASPTYYLGPFGMRPLLITTDDAATAADCQALADTTLRRVSGADQELTITSVPVPFLTPGDRVRVLDGVGTNATFQVAALTIPLDVTTAMIAIVKRPVT
jgi:hypothetical protein